MGGCILGGCVSLVSFSTTKEINDKGGLSVSDVTQRKVGLVIIGDEAWWWGEWVGQKRIILAWRNYWTAPIIKNDPKLSLVLSMENLPLCLFVKHELNIETHSKPSQTSKMELLAKIVNAYKPLTIFAKAPSWMFDDTWIRFWNVLHQLDQLLIRHIRRTFIHNTQESWT